MPTHLIPRLASIQCVKIVLGSFGPIIKVEEELLAINMAFAVIVSYRFIICVRTVGLHFSVLSDLQPRLENFMT